MPDVGRVVGRDAADVHPGGRPGRGGAHLAGRGVVQAQRQPGARAGRGARERARRARPAILRGRRRPLPRGQNGGQGIAGQPSTGNGRRPSCSSRSTRRWLARTSCRLRRARPESVPSSPRAGRPAALAAPRPRRRVSGSPAHPHSTVRSLGSAWNDTPWSTPCTRAARLDQHVAALAVGVVEDDVEHGHPAQPLVVGVPEHDRLTVGAECVEHPQPARRQRGRRHHVDQRCLVVVDGVDPQLDHAGAERPVAQHGRRHDAPAGGLATPRRPRPRGRPACRRGSPTAAARRRPACRRSGRSSPSWPISQNSVALDASTSRPSTTISPCAAGSVAARRAHRRTVAHPARRAQRR